MRDLIVSEIKRIAEENEGKPPGKLLFKRLTGITDSKWLGVYWARWGDAIEEAGFTRNALNRRMSKEQVLLPLANLCRKLKRFPTRAEIRLARQSDRDFPSHTTVDNHYPTNQALAAALRDLSRNDGYKDLSEYVPDKGDVEQPSRAKAVADGSVYLMKSGEFYKIGRSDDPLRRLRDIRITLPEDVTLVHSIRTDDPAGIESYWHRRFSEKRANGEWFRLMPDDVRAFTRRTFQ